MSQLCGAKQTKSTFTCREENLTVLTQNMEQVMDGQTSITAQIHQSIVTGLVCEKAGH